MMSDQVRRLIAREAARLMYEEGVREFRDAKRKAARRYGPVKALQLGSHLPSNAEIHAEFRRLLALHEEQLLPERLLRLRMLALRYLELLTPFAPLLVGSVLSGAATEQSDIDLHLFADDVEEVEAFLDGRGIGWEFELVTVRRGAEFLEYPHLYLEEEGVTIECSVYPPEERRRVPKSSINGKAMERADADKVRRLIAAMLSGDHIPPPPL